MTAPPGDRGQLDFLQHVQRIFDEGEFVATYKFALLIALVELAIERGEADARADEQRRLLHGIFLFVVPQEHSQHLCG